MKNATHTASLPICWKCSGKGEIGGFEHVEQGVCFVCRGTGHASARAGQRASVSPDQARRECIASIASCLDMLATGCGLDYQIGDDAAHTVGLSMRQTIAAAPADVARRAVMALARMGLAL